MKDIIIDCWWDLRSWSTNTQILTFSLGKNWELNLWRRNEQSVCFVCCIWHPELKYLKKKSEYKIQMVWNVHTRWSKSGVTFNLSNILMHQINRNIFFIIKYDNIDLFFSKQNQVRYSMLPSLIAMAYWVYVVSWVKWINKL